MSYKRLVIQNYKRFCGFEGNDYIASEFALKVIIEIINTYHCKNILELGLGIGSISDTVLKYSKLKNKNIHYYGTENNNFCLTVLENNVEDFNKIHLYPELKAVDAIKFDFIIIDGYNNTLKQVIHFCKKHSIIFIEGDRKGQTEIIKQIFPKSKHVNIVSLKKINLMNIVTVQRQITWGGGQIIFTNLTLLMDVFWFLLKVRTFIINAIRKLIK